MCGEIGTCDSPALNFSATKSPDGVTMESAPKLFGLCCLERHWKSIFDQLSLDKMIFTPVIWVLEHSGIFVASVVFNADSSAERERRQPVMKTLLCGSPQVLVSELTLSMSDEVMMAGDAVQLGGQEALLTALFMLGVKGTRISPTQVKTGYEADISERKKSFLQLLVTEAVSNS